METETKRNVSLIQSGKGKKGDINRRIIVTIGIDDYASLPKLRNAVNDAQGVQTLFTEKLGFEAPLSPLLDQAATKQAITELLEEHLPEEVGENDALVFFFAGHGVSRQRKGIESGYLAPVNAREKKWSDYIPIDSFFGRLNKIEARHIVVILDACHSGFALGNSVFVPRDTVPQFARDLQQRKSRHVLTSALNNQQAFDGGPIDGHSLFTGFLIRGLALGDADKGHGTIMTSDLGQYVQSEVAAYSKGKQTPMLGRFAMGSDEQGELLFKSLKIPVPEPLTTPPPTRSDDVPQRPIFELPFERNRQFTGREQLLIDLHDTFSATPDGVKTQVLSGMGGVGKSQLAAEYAYRHKKKYALIWWVRAETEPMLAADYLELANALSLSVKGSAELVVFVNIVNNWLQDATEPWLLIYDNAEDVEQLRTILPRKGNGNVLITSRIPNWGNRITSRPVPLFSKSDARQMLAAEQQEDVLQDADALADALGHLPLAIAQAQAFMASHGTSLKRYLELFEQHKQGLWQRERPPEDYNATIATTWDLALSQLRDSNPDAIKLLTLCAFLAADDIPIELLLADVSNVPSELHAIAENPFALEDAIAALYGYSLLQRQDDTIIVHRLVQAVVRHQLTPPKRQQWATLIIEFMCAMYPFDEYKMDTWDSSARLLPHALTVAIEAEKIDIALEQVATLRQQSAEYLRLQGEFRRAQDLVESALAIRQSLFGDKHFETASSLNFLGELLQEHAQFKKAQQLYDQALTIREEILGSDHADTAWSISNLGSLLREIGDYEAAQSHHERALQIRERILGADHPDTAISLGHLGNLSGTMGNYEAAQSHHERALQTNERILGVDHPYTAISLANIGELLRKLGDYEAAQSHHERALQINERVLGSDHPDTAASLNNLGLLYQSIGDYEAARPYHERDLQITERVLGSDHPDTATSLNNLGLLLQKMGNYEAAQSYYERSLQISEDVFGTEHPNIATNLINLGNLLNLMGDYEAARPYYERALEMIERTLGTGHPDTALSLNGLGGVLMLEKRFREAQSYLERALQIHEQVHGSYHPRLVNILLNLGIVTVGTGQFPKARRYLSWARSICKNAPQPLAECVDIERTIKGLPSEINRRKKKKRKKKRR